MEYKVRRSHFEESDFLKEIKTMGRNFEVVLFVRLFLNCSVVSFFLSVACSP